MQIGFVVSLIVALVIATFALMNPDMVVLRTFWGNYQISQSFVIILAASFGAVVAILLGLFGNLKRRLKIRELNNLQKAGEKQIAELGKKLAAAEELANGLNKDLGAANQKIQSLQDSEKQVAELGKKLAAAEELADGLNNDLGVANQKIHELQTAGNEPLA